MEDILPKNYYPDGLPNHMITVYQQLATKAKQEWLNNLFIISKYAEFPIEKVFLNYLILNAIMNHLPRIIFTQPSSSANEMMESHRAWHKAVFQMWKNFLIAIGETSPDARTELAFRECVHKLDISQKVKDDIIFYFTEGYESYDVIHLTIRSTFDDIVFRGNAIRPDILIWVPSEPKVKLLVECDGFIYHSNNYIFSDDREWDSFLRSNGFKVLRLSCREIITNPVKTAEKLLAHSIEEFKIFARRWIPLEDVNIYDYIFKE